MTPVESSCLCAVLESSWFCRSRFLKLTFAQSQRKAARSTLPPSGIEIQRPLGADSVEKQRVAGAESNASNGVRAPFWSGFSRLLRCRKDLRQFPEILGGGGEEEFVICAAWAT